MKKSLLLALLTTLAFAPLSAVDSAAPPKSELQSQIAALDAQIKEFTQARDQYAMRAQIAGNKASQIMDEDWMGYRQALAQQAQFQQDVVWLDQKITELKKQKADLEAKVV